MTPRETWEGGDQRAAFSCRPLRRYTFHTWCVSSDALVLFVQSFGSFYISLLFLIFETLDIRQIESDTKNEKKIMKYSKDLLAFLTRMGKKRWTMAEINMQKAK